MTLAGDADGDPRQVVIQLMPAPFSQGWVDNIRTLATAQWWDGTSINRVQDNYVVQWGDAGYDNPESGELEQKALPEGLKVVPESEYRPAIGVPLQSALRVQMQRGEETLRGAFMKESGEAKVAAMKRAIPRDAFADETIAFRGWPIAIDRETDTSWPTHCYGMVGVGRNYSPDTGTGAELYTVIGHAPRHLDRNIALVGRVIEGMEHLSSLPRGKGELGFYSADELDKRVPIVSIRLGNSVSQGDAPAFEYLSTESETFARYADARANRRDPFFIVPAGGADICNIPVPIRRVVAD